MDTAVSLFSPLFALSEKLETSVNKFYERKDLVQHNIGQLRQLDRRLSRAKELIPMVELRAEQDIVIQTQLAEFRERLGEDIDKIITWHDQINNATAKNRVRLMKQVLDGCEDNVNNFYEFLNSNLPALPEAPSLDYGRYVPRNTVPVNPPRLTLDYYSGDTCEGQLRCAVLEQKGSRIVAFVACGKGGVGKTCALRGLADDEEIRKTFPNGTLFIQLGNDAAMRDIVEGLANNVERTGGYSVAGKIRTSRTLEEASKIASDWFHGRNCLFLVDDIWKVNGISSNVFDTLGSMVNEKSRLVYTTRDKHFLGRAHKVIEFKEKEPRGELARRMLLRHGGFEEGDEPEGEKKVAFEAILDECQGLPLAFGIVGGVVLKKCRRKSEGRKHEAWCDFHKDMKGEADGSKLLEYSAEQYGGLPRIVDLSLEVMGSKYEYDKLFRALCVLRKQQSVPLEMLQKLWDLGSLKETEEVAESMDELSVVQMTEVNRVTFVQLHDLILDLAKYKASRRYETQSFYITLIGNYVRYSNRNSRSTLKMREDGVVAGNIEEEQVGTAIVSKYASKDAATGSVKVARDATLGQIAGQKMFHHAWWSSEDDGYLHNNVCRVLRNAGYTDGLLWLLLQPLWIVSRLLKGGICSVEEDLEEGKAVVTSNGAFESEHREHLEMIGKAARLGCTFVSENNREVWFQVHGRLLHHATVNERTREFVEKMERLAPRPWVKASIGILQQASGAVHDVIAGKGRVMCTSVEQEHVCFVWVDGREMGVSRYNTSTGSFGQIDLAVDRIGKTDRFWLPTSEYAAFLRDENSIVSAHGNGKMCIWRRETGELRDIVECKRRTSLKLGLFQWRDLLHCFGRICKEIRFVAFSADGKLVASTCDHHTIRVWNTLNGEAVGHPMRGHTDWVSCVAVSTDGICIVSGSWDKTVRVWEVESGEAVGHPMRGHTDWVRCVAFSADGIHIVSGSKDNTVRVWEVESGKAVGQPLRGHTSWVNCVAFSADGSRIVSGSLDDTVLVWEVESGKAVGQPLRGHTDWVTLVGVSTDGSRVVSGSDDWTVRVWDAESRGAVRHPLRGHTGLLSCVAVSGDGSFIVSGSDDKTVRVWEAESGEPVGKPLHGHSESVRCVTVSADGTRIISGSDDKTLRMWEVESGKAVGQPLCGHNGGVTSVAVSADGSRIVSGSFDKTVRMWEAESGEAVGKPLRGHSEFVRCVVLSGDGSRIVSGSYDQTVRVWDVGSGRAVGRPLVHDGLVLRVGTDAHGSRIASVDSRGVRKLWDTRRGVCVLTSADPSWKATVEACALVCSPLPEWRPRGRQVTARAEDGSAVVLATCEVEVENVSGSRGEVYWSRRLQSCRIVR